jgi:hypothetical protein
LIRFQSRPPKYILAGILAAFAVFSFANGFAVLGVPALVASVALATTSHYVELDFSKGYQGNFTLLFGLISMGGWEKLPDVHGVVLKRFSEFTHTSKGKYGGPETRENSRYVIMLSVKDSTQGWIVLEESVLRKARFIANEIAIKGGLEFIDYTV